MSIAGTSSFDNTDVRQIVAKLTGYVTHAAEDGLGMHEFERGLLNQLLAVGGSLMDQFLEQQHDGDLGDTAERDGKTLFRSQSPVARSLRSIFGQHSLGAFVYRERRHENSKICCRPVDEQLGIGLERYSPLLQEFSVMFCTEEAFRPGAEAFEMIFGQQLSVDTLERISRTMGGEAAEFLYSLPTPSPDEEGELLVMTLDGKGVPMVREDCIRLKACDQKPDRPGNRRMATVAAVYSVDRHVRTADQVLSGLFSSTTLDDKSNTCRPQPCHKYYTAWFGQVLSDDDERATGTQLATAWAGSLVEQRRQPNQPLVCLMDGQHSLWDCTACVTDEFPRNEVVEILDLLHVCSYVWQAAKAIHPTRAVQEPFVKAKLKAILEGHVNAVIRSLRYLATSRGLPKKKRDLIETACRYFESHRERMQYDEYLSRGYPIATGVIEGACRHIVKDRMERSGMKWTQPGAQALLHLRCLRSSGQWAKFQNSRRQPRSQQSLLPG